QIAIRQRMFLSPYHQQYKGRKKLIKRVIILSDIVIISGSPSDASRSEKILRYIASLIDQKKLSVTHISVRDLPYEDLFEGRYGSPAIKKVTSLIENSKGVIIGSPVYKASYSGVLKSFIDLLPQDVL